MDRFLYFLYFFFYTFSLSMKIIFEKRFVVRVQTFFFFQIDSLVSWYIMLLFCQQVFFGMDTSNFKKGFMFFLCRLEQIFKTNITKYLLTEIYKTNITSSGNVLAMWTLKDASCLTEPENGRHCVHKTHSSPEGVKYEQKFYFCPLSIRFGISSCFCLPWLELNLLCLCVG